MNNIEDLLTRISSEIDVLIREFKQKSSFYIASNSINKAQGLLSIIDSLNDMERDFERIKNNYSSFSTDQVRIPRPVETNRRPKKFLRVEFPDGTVIKENTAVSTFIKTIEKIGVQEVKSLNLKRGRGDLITSHPLETQAYHQIDNDYVYTVSSTPEKAKQLETISSLLDLRLKIDVIEI